MNDRMSCSNSSSSLVRLYCSSNCSSRSQTRIGARDGKVLAININNTFIVIGIYIFEYFVQYILFYYLHL